MITITGDDIRDIMRQLELPPIGGLKVPAGALDADPAPATAPAPSTTKRTAKKDAPVAPTYEVRWSDGVVTLSTQVPAAVVEKLVGQVAACQSIEELDRMEAANAALLESLPPGSAQECSDAIVARQEALAAAPEAEEKDDDLLGDEEPKPVTLDELRGKLKAFIDDTKNGGPHKAKELLTEFGVAKLSELDAARYGEFVAKLAA